MIYDQNSYKKRNILSYGKKFTINKVIIDLDKNQNGGYYG